MMWRRNILATVLFAGTVLLAGCETELDNPTNPGEGSNADNLRDGLKGYDSEPDVGCEVWGCDGESFGSWGDDDNGGRGNDSQNPNDDPPEDVKLCDAIRC